MAADAVVNEALVQSGHAIPRPALTLAGLLAELDAASHAPDALAKWDVDRLYNPLLQRAPAMDGRWHAPSSTSRLWCLNQTLTRQCARPKHRIILTRRFGGSTQAGRSRPGDWRSGASGCRATDAARPPVKIDPARWRAQMAALVLPRGRGTSFAPDIPAAANLFCHPS